MNYLHKWKYVSKKKSFLKKTSTKYFNFWKDKQNKALKYYSAHNTSAALFHDSGWWTIVFHTFIKRNKKELLICSQFLWIRFYSSYRELSLDLIWYTVLWLENVNPTCWFISVYNMVNLQSKSQGNLALSWFSFFWNLTILISIIEYSQLG